MSTQPPVLTRRDRVALVTSYFAAVDSRDMDAVLSLFASDATITIQTHHVTYSGIDQIRGMFADLLANSKTLSHQIAKILVDDATGAVATEQHAAGELAGRTRNNMYNCNFFDIGADGKFTRVVIWLAESTEPRGE